jgi:uncharacterized membrane protein
MYSGADSDLELEAELGADPKERAELVMLIDLARNVYDLIRKFVDLVAQRDASGARSMSPVWLRFGGPGGAMVLGLLSSPEPVIVGGHTYLAMLVPTARMGRSPANHQRRVR